MAWEHSLEPRAVSAHRFPILHPSCPRQAGPVNLDDHGEEKASPWVTLDGPDEVTVIRIHREP